MIASSKGPEDFLWTNIGNRKTGDYLTREQYANLVKNWKYFARVDPKRHLKSAAIYDATQNMAACQHLLGLKNIAVPSTIWAWINAKFLILPSE